MTIRHYLSGERFDSETLRVLGVALEMARCALRTEERSEDTDTIIAKHIIALALGGERDADRLCDSARPMDVPASCSSPPPRPVPPCSSQVARSSCDKRAVPGCRPPRPR